MLSRFVRAAAFAAFFSPTAALACGEGEAIEAGVAGAAGLMACISSPDKCMTPAGAVYSSTVGACAAWAAGMAHDAYHDMTDLPPEPIPVEMPELPEIPIMEFELAIEQPDAFERLSNPISTSSSKKGRVPKSFGIGIERDTKEPL